MNENITKRIIFFPGESMNPNGMGMRSGSIRATSAPPSERDQIRTKRTGTLASAEAELAMAALGTAFGLAAAAATPVSPFPPGPPKPNRVLLLLCTFETIRSTISSTYLVIFLATCRLLVNCGLVIQRYQGPVP